MKIEIWSDVICPWCYIGKRRFEMALDKFEHKSDVQVIWRSFELDPHAPAQYPGTLEEMLVKKYAVSPQQAAGMNANVTALAKAVGLEYHLSKARPGNTFDAHRLLYFAVSKQLGDRATERMMQAYFSEALAVGDHDALAKLAPEFGISESDARTLLLGDANADLVRADEARAAEYGIRGVPYFLFNESAAISGAQAVEAFSAALQQAYQAA